MDYMDLISLSLSLWYICWWPGTLCHQVITSHDSQVYLFIFIFIFGSLVGLILGWCGKHQQLVTDYFNRNKELHQINDIKDKYSCFKFNPMMNLMCYSYPSIESLLIQSHSPICKFCCQFAWYFHISFLAHQGDRVWIHWSTFYSWHFQVHFVER